MSPNIGYATLSIIPSTKGIQKSLSKDLSPTMSAAGKTAGESLSKSFGSVMATNTMASLDSLGGRITGWAKKGALVGVGAVVAGVGISIAKGFSRLQAIDDAEGKLRGLGHTAEGIDTIMESALDSVRGTAFGLGDAATVAATAVAAGVKPGEDLTRYLSLIGDTSAIAGVGLSEVGSIINKMTTGQKVYTAELNQLADRGLPVFTWLQEEFGVTSEELKKMVSAGEVDSETFMNVLEDNIGGAALASGDTFRGAFANMQAAMGRFGAQLIGPLFKAAKGWFGGVTVWIDQLTAKVGPFAEAFAEKLTGWIAEFGPVVKEGFGVAVEWVGRLVDRIRDLIGWIKDNEDQVRKLLKALLPAVGALAGLAVSVRLGVKAFKLLKAATPLGIILALATGLIYAYQNSETFRQVVDRALGFVTKNVLPALRAAFEWVVDWFRRNWPAIQEAIAATVSWLQTHVLPVVEAVMSWLIEQFRAAVAYVKEIWPEIQETIAGVIEAVKIIIETTVAVITAIWEKWGADIIAFATDAWEIIKTRIKAAIDIVRGIINTVTALIRGDWQAVWDGIKLILQGVWDLIVSLVDQALITLRLILTVAWDLIKLGAQIAWDGIKAAIQTVWDGIKSAASTTWDAIKAAIMVPIDALKGLVNTSLTGLQSLIGTIWDAIKRSADRVWGAIKTAITTPINLAKDGVLGAFRLVRDTVSSIWNAIKDRIAGPIQGILDFLQNIIDKAESAIAFMGRVTDLNPLDGSFLGFNLGWGDGERALGGPVRAGGTYLVGERGPEIVQFGRSGHVFSNSDSQAMLSDTRASGMIQANAGSGGAGGRGVTINGDVNNNTEVDADAFYRRLNSLSAVS